MSNKLKPCPFCGVTPDEDSHYINQGTKWGGILCCIEGPEVRTSYKAWPFFKQDAIDAWNDRKEPIQWQPIETWVDDGGQHVRGLWVTNNVTNETYFQQFLGQIHEDSGDFVDHNGDDFGWAVGDYTHWMPLPEPPENKP